MNASTNQLSGYTYDANGNLISTGYTYDVENRLSFANGGGAQYFYDAQNKRVWQASCTTSGYCNPGSSWVLNLNQDTVNLFGADGKQLASYQAIGAWNPSGGTNVAMGFTYTNTRVYFGGRLVGQQVGTNGYLAVIQDRLGSLGKYYPYGEERNSPQLPNDQVKFATYTRDSATGNDYADQRYYTSTLGRFMTDDPSGDGWDAENPQSWNTYAYSLGEPINLNDPTGLVDLPITNGGDPYSCLNQQLIPWMQSHGFTVGNNLDSLFNTPTGVLGLTLYLEDTRGTEVVYADLAQVMINRYQLQFSNPGLARSLGLPAGSFSSVVMKSSTVWRNGDLTDSEYNTLVHVLDGSVVGSSAKTNAAACGDLISALNISLAAQAYLSSSSILPNASGISNQTYWFFTPGSDPVNHHFWQTTSVAIGGWVFESYVGQVPPAGRHMCPAGDSAERPLQVGVF